MNKVHGAFLKGLIVTAGGNSLVGRRMNIRPQAISKWIRLGEVPIERVPELSEITGVPRHVIRPDRPDMFPPPAVRARECA